MNKVKLLTPCTLICTSHKYAQCNFRLEIHVPTTPVSAVGSEFHSSSYTLVSRKKEKKSYTLVPTGSITS